MLILIIVATLTAGLAFAGIYFKDYFLVAVAVLVWVSLGRRWSRNSMPKDSLTFEPERCRAPGATILAQGGHRTVREFDRNGNPRTC